LSAIPPVSFVFPFLQKVLKFSQEDTENISECFHTSRQRSNPISDKKQQKRQYLTKNILTVRDVAAYLRLTETTICKLAASGDLPGFKIGKSWRFHREEVLRRISAAKQNEKDAA